MSHYAKVVKGKVTQVNVVDDEFFVNNPDRYKGTWIQTSYNTKGGVHTLGGTPLRKNFAGIGYTYDATRDAFYEPQPYKSWLLDENTCFWVSPIPYPTDGKDYKWNEDIENWELNENQP